AEQEKDEQQVARRGERLAEGAEGEGIEEAEAAGVGVVEVAVGKLALKDALGGLGKQAVIVRAPSAFEARDAEGSGEQQSDSESDAQARGRGFLRERRSGRGGQSAVTMTWGCGKISIQAKGNLRGTPSHIPGAARGHEESAGGAGPRPHRPCPRRNFAERAGRRAGCRMWAAGNRKRYFGAAGSLQSKNRDVRMSSSTPESLKRPGSRLESRQLVRAGAGRKADREGGESMATPQGVFVHPHALCESEQVGEGTRVWAFAHVMKGAKVGKGCNLCDHSFVESGAVLGDNVTVKNSVSVWDCVEVGNNVFIGPNAVFTNDLNPRAEVKKPREQWVPTRIKDGVSIGANATIVCGITLGRYAFVAAGAVVAS